MNRKKFKWLFPDVPDDLMDYVEKTRARHDLLNLYVEYDLANKSYGSAPEWVVPAAPRSQGHFGIVFRESRDHPQPYLFVQAQWAVLDSQMMDHWVYRIIFSPGDDASKDTLSHPSFAPLRVARGYVGMTSRHPFLRLKEHWQKVHRGEGHALHKSWAELAQVVPGAVPAFNIIANVKTRAKAMDLEESFVSDWGTLIPNGLNVIPGGMAGVRELWKLNLLDRTKNPTEEEREAALERLESKRSSVSMHYRRGHIRKLPTKCKVETTWVNHCWVGLTNNPGKVAV